MPTAYRPAPLPLRAAMLIQYGVGGAVMPFISLVFEDRGFSFDQISFVFTMAAVTMLVMPFIWGMLADRFIPLNRLFTLLNLLVVAALGSLAIFRSYTCSLIAYTVYYACINPGFSLLMALCFHHLPNPKEQFGRLRAWGSLGWVVPFLPISLWLASGHGKSMEFILWIGVCSSLTMTVITFWLPSTPPGASRNPDDPNKKPYFTAVKELLHNSDYRTLAIAFFMIAGSFSIQMYYSPPLLEKIGLSRVWIGPVQVLGVIVEIILFQWHPALLRRWNYSLIIAIGCITLAVRQLLYGTTDNLWLLCLSFSLLGVSVVFFYITTSLVVNSIADKAVRATAQSFLFLIGHGFGPMFSNGVAGLIASHYKNNLHPVFLFATGLSVTAMLLIFFHRHSIDKAGRKH